MSPPENLEDAISKAAQRLNQAIQAGEIKPGDRKHPALIELLALSGERVERRDDAVASLREADQAELVKKWKLLRKKHLKGVLKGEEFEIYRGLKLHFLDQPHPEVERIKKQIDEKIVMIDRRIKEAIRPPVRVRYSAYRKDSELGIPIDNLDEIVVVGRAYFVCDPNTRYDGNCPVYRSEILENPTWLQVAQLANNMIGTCGFTEHVFLENVWIKKESNGVKEMQFGMGS